MRDTTDNYFVRSRCHPLPNSGFPVSFKIIKNWIVFGANLDKTGKPELGKGKEIGADFEK
jgi:hypothetical protein